MESSTLSSSEIKDALNAVIFYKVNVDNEKSVAQKYKASSIPAYRIIDGSESVFASGEGMKSVREFKRWIDSGLKQKEKMVAIPTTTPKFSSPVQF